MRLNDVAETLSTQYAAIYRHCHPRYTVALSHQAVRVLQLAGEGKAISVHEVCAELNCAPNTASEIIARLAAKKLVVKKRRETDERIVEIQITQEGSVALEEQTGLDRIELEKKLRNLPPSEIKSILKGFSLLLECLKRGG